MREAMLERLLNDLEKLIRIGYKEDNKENFNKMIRYMCISAYQLNIPLNLVAILRNHSDFNKCENIKLRNFDDFVKKITNISKEIRPESLSYEEIKKELFDNNIIIVR